ncbi:putative RNA pseudouridine synthase [Thermoflexales bacterium]|nr:putative RNA pseudouridine synthase [Thermoflexales bacterium]
MTEERIQKLLAQAGYGSRRACEEYLTEQRVTVNGKVAELGAKADPVRDVIKVDGKRVHFESNRIYLALNKPIGVVTTNSDEFGRQTVRDLIPIEGHLYPVGRLDADSEGLVLLTNDGDLANALTHPRYEHEKEYRVLVEGEPSAGTLKAWRHGVLLEGQQTAPARVDVVDAGRGQTWLRIIMHEGRKRQIREVAGMLGHRVKYLQRVRVGPIRLTTLKVGEWRHLSASEIKLLLGLIAPSATKRSPNTRTGRGTTGVRGPREARGAKNPKRPSSTRPPRTSRSRSR